VASTNDHIVVSTSDQPLVTAYHQVTGDRGEIPEHWLGKDSPFPGQWGKTPPSATQSREAAKAIAKSNAQEG
jgi:hypothetical protein